MVTKWSSGNNCELIRRPAGDGVEKAPANFLVQLCFDQCDQFDQMSRDQLPFDRYVRGECAGAAADGYLTGPKPGLTVEWSTVQMVKWSNGQMVK
jgi:hypothetical protein